MLWSSHSSDVCCLPTLVDEPTPVPRYGAAVSCSFFFSLGGFAIRMHCLAPAVVCRSPKNCFSVCLVWWVGVSGVCECVRTRIIVCPCVCVLHTIVVIEKYVCRWRGLEGRHNTEEKENGKKKKLYNIDTWWLCTRGGVGGQLIPLLGKYAIVRLRDCLAMTGW